MVWISVNPDAEREEIIETAMVLSGEYGEQWDKGTPLATELQPEKIAELFNSADSLGVDIYSVEEADGFTQCIRLQVERWRDRDN